MLRGPVHDVAIAGVRDEIASIGTVVSGTVLRLIFFFRLIPFSANHQARTLPPESREPGVV